MRKIRKFYESDISGLTDKEKDNICSDIDSEGFDYAFMDYSSFEEIKDPEFHRLRQQYLKAHKALSSYVGCDDWDS